MAGNFDLPSWLTPQPGWTAADAFIKGSQAGAAIAANRLRAKQLYVEVQQNQQQMDLAERKFIADSEASSLRSKVLQTKMDNDAADFETLREWWPKFQASEDGEMEPPVLRDENAMLRVSAAVAAKREKIGQAAFAALMAEPGFDLAKPENQKRYFELMSKHKNIMGKLGPDGIMQPIKAAETLKRLRDEADSRIAARTDRAKLNTLIEARRALLADSTIDVNDARIAKYDKDIAFEERRLLLGEGNLKVRSEELDLKTKRFNEDKWTSEDKIEYNRRSKVIEANEKLTAEDKDLAIQEIREDIEGKRQQREGFKEKKAAAVSAAPPSIRVPVIGPDGTMGTIPESQLEEALKAGYKRP